ncbi:Inositol-pentakisphosphate 2-kinase [Tulasnella sp. 403]|nr:Inositol-pentakisphosphate 2-kinase [Tulasnella sp. 403]
MGLLPSSANKDRSTTPSRSVPDATKTSPSEWSYVSEGGATIVFSYSGKPNPDFDGTVLRLRKKEIQPPPKEIFKPLDIAEGVDNASSEEDNDDETSSSEDEDEPDDPTIAFQSRITSKLIPPQHLPRLDPVKVKGHWLKELAKLSQDKRAEARRKADAIDIRKKKAVIATDLIGGEGWAVEIKPKWAILSNPTHLSEETKPTKASYCRFCMHTHQRALKSPSAFVSKYCPMDLFSEDEERIRKAVAALWEAWIGSDGSINNMKIFVNGTSILPTDTQGLEALHEDLQLPEQTHESTSDLLASILPAFADAVVKVLTTTPVLQTLRNLQRTLDPLDIEGVAKLWKEYPNEAAIGVGSREVNLKEWESFLQEYLEETKKDPSELQAEWNNPSQEKLRYYLLAYLLSGTFKDCSVILRFKPNIPPTITAIDLDPKSVTRLAKWEKLDLEIVRCYTETGDKTRPPCRSPE